MEIVEELIGFYASRDAGELREAIRGIIDEEEQLRTEIHGYLSHEETDVSAVDLAEKIESYRTLKRRLDQAYAQTFSDLVTMYESLVRPKVEQLIAQISSADNESEIICGLREDLAPSTVDQWHSTLNNDRNLSGAARIDALSALGREVDGALEA